MNYQEICNKFGLKTLVDANLTGANLRDADLSDADLRFANLTGAKLKDADLTRANLRDADLTRANLRDADLTRTNLKDADLTRANLRGANLSDANLCGANLIDAKLSNADLTDSDLTGVDLCGSDLSNANLRGIKGLATKEQEMSEANRILLILSDPAKLLNMSDWHTCQTTHCLAGWSEPNLDYPASVASRKMPTLTKYFYSTNDEAMSALIRVASGKESIWNYS